MLGGSYALDIKWSMKEQCTVFASWVWTKNILCRRLWDSQIIMFFYIIISIFQDTETVMVAAFTKPNDKGWDGIAIFNNSLWFDLWRFLKMSQILRPFFQKFVFGVIHGMLVYRAERKSYLQHISQELQVNHQFVARKNAVYKKTTRAVGPCDFKLRCCSKTRKREMEPPVPRKVEGDWGILGLTGY